MTINYTEKGAGLHAAIQAAGHWLEQRDGVWISSDDTAVQALIDGYTLAAAIEHRQRECQQLARALRDRVIAAISPGEMASWPVKRAEALAWNATQDADQALLLQLEATARGVPLADVVARVLANAAAYAQLEAAISGRCGAHRDALAACTSFAAVAAHDLSTGWPAI